MTDLRKAAEMALEALETLDCGDTYKTHNAAAALRQAIEQAQREKQEAALRELAEIDRELGLDYMQAPVDAVNISQERVDETAKCKHEWVGLTHDEFQKCVDGLEDLEDCWVAIEAKLKEKNT